MTPTLIMILAIVLSGLIAGLTTLRSSREVVDQYVSVWEEEIARNLLLKGDAGLFDKIQRQIIDLASDVDTTGGDAAIKQASGACFAGQVVSVTLYGTPAGQLQVCRSPRKLFFRSLGSPVFAFGILAGLMLAMWLVRRSSRAEADRALNELAVRVAHDIRSPLMALKVAAGQAHNFAGHPESSANEEVKKLINAATERISHIADELLIQYRSVNPDRNKPVATATVPTTSSAVTLADSIRQLISEKRLLGPAGLIFDFRAPRAAEGVLPATSSADLERIVANLIQNAIEAVDSEKRIEKTPRIVVDATETEKNISITIRDNGVGIPSEILPRIGEIGFSYGKPSGNGIGFASARRWARERGGELDVRSLEGTGTEVRLVIPRL